MSKALSEIQYAFYLTVHPFKGFWEIKHERGGGMGAAPGIFVFFLLTSVLGGFYGGYLFNADGGLRYNVWKNLAVLLLTYLIWCVANWCLTSLFEGEGTFRDICRFTAYALLPLAMAQLILLPLGHILALQESAFYTLILNLGMLWTGFLLFVGLVVTHQYSVWKSILTTAITLLGMCIILYILLLFFNLIQQVCGFAVTFYREAVLRFS